MGHSATAAILAISALATVPAAGAFADPNPHIVIRTYGAASPAGILQAAQAVASDILQQAGVGSAWLGCDTPAAAHNPCLSPLADHELAIRFVRLPPHLTPNRIVTLGDSLVDTRLGGGSLATIYADRVAALASRGRIEEPLLLGRAVAHEIGHLLLGTPAHASSGLMRAEWSQHTLRQMPLDEWTFTRADAQALREAVRFRTARLMASARSGG